jgi:hypothetical protein
MFTFEFESRVREMAREKNISFEKALKMEVQKTYSLFSRPGLDVKSQTLLSQLKVYGGLNDAEAKRLYNHVRTRSSDGTLYMILRTFFKSRLSPTKWPISFEEEKTQKFLGSPPKQITLRRTITRQVYPPNWLFMVMPLSNAESCVLSGLDLSGPQLDMYRTGRQAYLYNNLEYCIKVAKDYHHDRKDLAIVAYSPICLDGFEGEDWRKLTRKELFSKCCRFPSAQKPDYVIGPGITYHFQWKRKSPPGVEILHIHSHKLATHVNEFVSTTLSLVF